VVHDYSVLARQFLRAVRRNRSQVAFSRRLGFASNVAAQWESGRRVPRILTVFAACERMRIDVRAALRSFRPSTADHLDDQHKPLSGETLARWLDAQRGKETVTAISRRASLSRYQATRFFSGHCEPRLHEFFALIDATTGRLSDLVALLIDIGDVPELTRYHAQVVASRRLAFDEPWSSAVLSAVECLSSLKCEVMAGTIASAFALDRERVAAALKQLEQANIIQRVKGRYRLAAPLVIDTGAAPEGARRLRRHWTLVAHARLEQPRSDDVFSYNVFSVSREDLRLIGRLQREHFQRLRAIIAKSSSETVALLNMQLMEWDVTPARTS
jgi:transcriptional regulator with XRE-family HTH domain